MKKNTPPSTYYHGKNLPKTQVEQRRMPITGEPNSFIDVVDTKKLITRRVIGVDGIATKDYDTADVIHKTDHKHPYTRVTKSDKVVGRRETSQPLNKKEQKHFNKVQEHKERRIKKK